MDRLILVRHGKAESESSSGDDFDRRLTPRGIAESTAMGVNLAELGFTPDVVLVSSAERARGTWDAVAEAFPGAQVRFDRNLYLADAETLRAAADAAGADCAVVMLVAHNPGLQELAVGLLQEGSAPASLVARAHRMFPTAAAAVFLLDDNGRPGFDGLFFPERRG